MKTHHWVGMTCSMKNLYGVLPGIKYGWPKNPLHVHGIPNSILDLTATIRPHFAIVDAVTAMEGDGPIMGRPRAARIRRDGVGSGGGRRHVRSGDRIGSREDRLLETRRSDF